MKAFLATTVIATAGLLATGCATKKYVRNTTAPIQAKVDQVGEQTSRNGQSIEETRTQVKEVDERAQTGINAAQERASTADNDAQKADQHAQTADQHASDARNRADQAAQSVSTLREEVANLDDYKLQTSVSVPFAFDKFSLTKNAKETLDQLADSAKADKRFFVSVEGYTDKTGSQQYNEALSRRRADSVVEYLVGQHDLPIYRIHMVGLGEQKPVDEGKTREARAKSRRVEVQIFVAEGVSASSASLARGSSDSTADRLAEKPNQ